MKKICYFSAAFFLQLFCANSARVTLQVPQYKQVIAYLTYYMGPNLNVADSAAVSNSGTAIFKGPEKLRGGIYVVVFPR